jgi:endonuclease/exonuclease/phosphatase family metal-dependent hydrolase
MKILLYNIAYATGSPSSYTDAVLKSHRALKSSKKHFQHLKKFILDNQPDLIGLIEIDQGSYRTHFSCQAEQISKSLNYQVHGANKYKHTLLKNFLPILRKQGNAILTNHKSESTFHFLKKGVKRLMIEVEFKEFNFFLVHLSLSLKVRRKQLKEISELLKERSQKPFIIAGDFNTFQGEEELKPLMKAFNLKNSNREKKPTFPSWAPEYQLDYILYSPGIIIHQFEVPTSDLSDHLPLLAEIEVYQPPSTTSL